MNYIKKFENSQALSVSVGNSYSQDQLMDIFLDNFRQVIKCTTQTANHQLQLRREGNFTDQKYLSITYLQTNYFNLDISSGSGRNIEGANLVHTRYTFCGGANHSA